MKHVRDFVGEEEEEGGDGNGERVVEQNHREFGEVSALRSGFGFVHAATKEELK